MKKSLLAEYLTFVAGRMTASQNRAFESRLAEDGSSVEQFGEKLLRSLTSVGLDTPTTADASPASPEAPSQHDAELAAFRAGLQRSELFWSNNHPLIAGEFAIDPMPSTAAEREIAASHAQAIVTRLKGQAPTSERQEQEISNAIRQLRASTREGAELVEAYAEALHQAGRADQAMSILNDAIAAVVYECGPLSSAQSRLLRRRASLLARADRLNDALSSLQKAKRLLQIEREPTDAELQQALLELTSCALQTEVLDTAEETAQLLAVTLRLAAGPASQQTTSQLWLACIAHDRAILLARAGISMNDRSSWKEHSDNIERAIDRIDSALTLCPPVSEYVALAAHTLMCQGGVLRSQGKPAEALARFVAASSLYDKLPTPSTEAVWNAIEEARCSSDLATDLPSLQAVTPRMERASATIDTLPADSPGLRAFADHAASSLDIASGNLDQAEKRSRRSSASATVIERLAPRLAFAFIIRHGDVLVSMSRFKEARDEYSRAEALLRDRQLLTEPYVQRIKGCIAASWGAEGEDVQARELIRELEGRASSSGIIEPEVFARLVGSGGTNLQSPEMLAAGPLRTTTRAETSTGRAVRNKPLYCDWAQPTFAELRRLGILTW